MHGFFVSFCRWHIFRTCIAILSVLTLAGCETPAERQRLSLEQDQQTCANFGAFAAPDHLDCMLVQQQRRDTQQTDRLERARIAFEIVRNMQEMTDSRIRRCERDRRLNDRADRRRRPCT
ncbi:hypothetical protein U1872_13585 [Sphingomonas sp. RB3P16]|uniref:hypothetical protein n=1 Tax=Parasphingomonas frigoris TaxID=3096163 RepID=UPI002FC71F8B